MWSRFGGVRLTWYVVDGPDGCGKSTTAGLLRDALESRGRSVLLIENPDRGTRVGRLCASLLLRKGKAAVIAASAFYFLGVLSSIRRMRRTDRDDVVFVRYLLEVSYFPEGMYRGCYRLASGVLQQPDVGILVEVSPETAMERISLRGEDLEVFENAERIGVTASRMRELVPDWHVIDNNGSEDDLREGIESILDFPGDF